MKIINVLVYSAFPVIFRFRKHFSLIFCTIQITTPQVQFSSVFSSVNLIHLPDVLRTV